MLHDIHVPRETEALLEKYVDLLLAAAGSQNLISTSTIGQVWDRHVRDSVQLLAHVPKGARTCLDLGSGGGLPGIILAICRPKLTMTLVEQRALRVSFLRETSAKLDLANVVVVQGNASTLKLAASDAICARAFAPLAKLFRIAHHLAHDATVWILPKGRTAREELAAARESWHGEFRLMPSQTDPDASIIVATGVHPKARR